MPPAAAPALSMHAVDHTFGDGPGARAVLRNLTLEVRQGEIVILMGPSGCGKTTVLTLAAGLRSVQSGSVRTLGTELQGAGQSTVTAVRRRIGFVCQTPNLHGSLTVRGNVRMGLEVHGPSALAAWEEQCDRVLAAVGLDAWGDAYPATLSGGQRQRAAIARALVTQPPLILADEPTSALDQRTGREIVDLLRTLARRHGSAVLLVTHDDRILDIADRVVRMEDGRIAGERRAAASASGPDTEAVCPCARA